MKTREEEPSETKSHGEKRILEGCISLMQRLTNEFEEYYRWLHGDSDGGLLLADDERFSYAMSYIEIVRELFLKGTSHSGGTSTIKKCDELGVEWGECVSFEWPKEEEEES